MDKIIRSNSTPQSEYWNLITSLLSSYEVKNISNDGTVKRRIVKHDYFLANDAWNVNDIGQIPNFHQQFQNYKGTRENLNWLPLENDLVRMELKFVFYHKLFEDEWSFNTIFMSNNTKLSRLIEFLNEKHSSLRSFLDLDINKTEKEWIWWLSNKGVNIKRKQKDTIGNEFERQATINFFPRNLYNSLVNLTDSREEFEKDVWDVRNLNKVYGIVYNNTTSKYTADFSRVKNVVFRQELKKYIKARLLGGKNFSWSTGYSYVYIISRFFNFISDIEPSWNDLNGLTRDHLNDFLKFLNQYAKTNLKQKNKHPKSFIFNNLTMVNTFLDDTQRFEYSIAPKLAISRIILPEDYPKLDKKSDNDIDYIPDYVLEQLFENINELHPDVQPIVWVAFKTGLRISDSLSLTHSCLIKLNGKYSLVTDVEKTYTKGHTIPIDHQLADMIAVLIHNSKKLSNDDNNPNKYIFVRYRGSRKGNPFGQHWVKEKLNELAKKKNITDEVGNLFHFKNHQFRHTFAVKMLNGGADILTVQELLAHASPEMTMRYARLIDDTKRKEFEKVVKQGVFSFDINGEIQQISETEDIPEDILDMMWKDEKLNALDNPYGTCRARVNGNCPLAAEPPCLTANDGKPCFDLAVGMDSFDVKKYELLMESATKNIQVAKEYGREEMVKANEKNLERYLNIYETIKSGNVIFGRFDRMKRQLEHKKKKGVTNG